MIVTHVQNAVMELRGKAANHRHEERKNREYAEAYELAAILVENAIDKDSRAANPTPPVAEEQK